MGSSFLVLGLACLGQAPPHAVDEVFGRSIDHLNRNGHPRFNAGWRRGNLWLAQTPPQFFTQLMEAAVSKDDYLLSDSDLGAISEGALFTVLEHTSVRFSGRPENAHTLGAASAALTAGLPPAAVAALLVRSQYNHTLTAWPAEQLCPLRMAIVNTVGAPAESLAWTTTFFPAQSMNESIHIMRRGLDKRLLTARQGLAWLIRMAEEVDEHYISEQLLGRTVFRDAVMQRGVVEITRRVGVAFKMPAAATLADMLEEAYAETNTFWDPTTPEKLHAMTQEDDLAVNLATSWAEHYEDMREFFEMRPRPSFEELFAAEHRVHTMHAANDQQWRDVYGPMDRICCETTTFSELDHAHATRTQAGDRDQHFCEIDVLLLKDSTAAPAAVVRVAKGLQRNKDNSYSKEKAGLVPLPPLDRLRPFNKA